jgi:hypothetical protein
MSSLTVFETCLKCSAIPAAPIHATPHFVAFFVPRVVVYASSQDFVETALGQPYLNKTPVFSTVAKSDKIGAKQYILRNLQGVYYLSCWGLPSERINGRATGRRDNNGTDGEANATPNHYPMNTEHGKQ